MDQIPIFMLAVAFILMSFIYLFLAIYCLVRLYKVLMNNNAIFLARTFYISMLLTCVAYLVAMLVYLYQVFTSDDTVKNKTTSQGFERILIDTLYIPDAIFWVMYVALYYQVLKLFYAGHMRSGNLVDSGRFNPASNKNMNRLISILFVYTIGQTVIIVLFNVKYMPYFEYVLINIITNASLPISLVISECYLNFRFSGSPFRSRSYEKITVRLNRLIVFFAVMRLVQIAANILLLSHLDYVYQFLIGSNKVTIIWQIIMVCAFIIDLLLVSVIPFVFALQNTFTKIFLMDIDQETILTQDDEVQDDPEIEHVQTDSLLVRQTFNRSNSGSGVRLKPQFRNTEDQSYLDHKLFLFKAADIVKQSSKNRTNGLGRIDIGNIANTSEMHAFRVIEFQQLSSYVLEEVELEIKRINELKHDYVSHIHGSYHDHNQIILAYKFYEHGSLYDYVFQKQDDQENKYDTKVMLAIQLARGIEYLHNQRFPHGHLTTSNIMLNKNFRVKIVDLGFVPLKKYCSIILGYQNKSRFTAPEILAERGNIVQNVTLQGDIYSLGMVLYEIFNEKVAFKDANLKDIAKVVIEQHGRPKIDQEVVGDDMSILIRWCWQQDPVKRPTISEVVKALENIKESLDMNTSTTKK